MNELLLALVGNPNAGKSTIFNALTGANQHVGNWPGKTVARKEGSFQVADYQVTMVDLPGAYSLTAYSPEETITRDFLLEERPFLVVNVVDAANLERNLYLTVQVLELGLPLILVLNMSDVARERGISIDTERLGQTLQVPVVWAVASQGKGIYELKEAIVVEARLSNSRPPVVPKLDPWGIFR